jgi:hypothetical protein
VASVLLALALVIAACAAWGGLGWIILNVEPTRQFAQLGLYVFAFVAITASVSLLAWLVVRRHSPITYVAHAMLLAVIALFALWLQSLRVLTPIVAVLLLGLYTFLELAILFGTRGSVELPLRR